MSCILACVRLGGDGYNPSMDIHLTPTWDGLAVNARLVTLDAEAGYGIVEDGALGWRDGRLAYVGARDRLPAAEDMLAAEVVDAGGDCVTPGLVDCHTHVVFAGDRASEFEQRLQGSSYEAIARAGGGICPPYATPAPLPRTRCWRSRCRALLPCARTA